MRRLTLILLVGFALVASAKLDARADYEIGAADVLSVTYWQQAELNQEVTVRQNGKISLAVIGDVTASGLTTTQLEQRIVAQMSRYNPTISQVVVIVKEFKSRRVFVNGQVQNPAYYAFEEIPDLWGLIKEAGGPTGEADLAEVAVLLPAESGGGMFTVDLAKVLTTGDLSRLPDVPAGATVNVPRSVGGLSSDRLVPADEPKNVYFVYGEVTSPGRHALDTRMDVLEAIVAAGGPLSHANLEKVRVLTKGPGGTSVFTFDLGEYSKTGWGRRYRLRPEDTIVIPRRSAGVLGGAWQAIRNIAAVSGAIYTVLLVANP